MSLTAIIGGSGFDRFDELKVNDAIIQDTPYGPHSGPIIKGHLGETECLFLPRHNSDHSLPPHKVNYRANIWALKKLGVRQIIAFNVVGGINPNMPPDSIVLPGQIIDYTFEREHTFYDGRQQHFLDESYQNIQHIDFSQPYCRDLKQKIIGFFKKENIEYVPHGVYGCTQGPRLETVAEIERLKRDGCDIVGMTAMPEAALAAELDINYVSIAIVVNWAAGIDSENLSMVHIMNTVRKNMQVIKNFLPDLLRVL